MLVARIGALPVDARGGSAGRKHVACDALVAAASRNVIRRALPARFVVAYCAVEVARLVVAESFGRMFRRGARRASRSAAVYVVVGKARASAFVVAVIAVKVALIVGADRNAVSRNVLRQALVALRAAAIYSEVGDAGFVNFMIPGRASPVACAVIAESRGIGARRRAFFAVNAAVGSVVVGEASLLLIARMIAVRAYEFAFSVFAQSFCVGRPRRIDKAVDVVKSAMLRRVVEEACAVFHVRAQRAFVAAYVVYAGGIRVCGRLADRAGRAARRRGIFKRANSDALIKIFVTSVIADAVVAETVAAVERRTAVCAGRSAASRGVVWQAKPPFLVII